MTQEEWIDRFGGELGRPGKPCTPDEVGELGREVWNHLSLIEPELVVLAEVDSWPPNDGCS